MIPSSRPKLSDLYTPSQSKLLENHTLHSGTYLYSAYMAIHPPPPGGVCPKVTQDSFGFWITFCGSPTPCHWNLNLEFQLYASLLHSRF